MPSLQPEVPTACNPLSAPVYVPVYTTQVRDLEERTSLHVALDFEDNRRGVDLQERWIDR